MITAQTSDREHRAESLRRALAAAGAPVAEVEARDGVAVVRPQDWDGFAALARLRESLVRLGREAGFSHVALELPLP